MNGIKIDYKGCNPEVAEDLQNGVFPKCTGQIFEDEGFILDGNVVAYIRGEERKYVVMTKSVSGESFYTVCNDVVVVGETQKIVISEASMVAELKSRGYIKHANHFYHEDSKNIVKYSILFFCGKNPAEFPNVKFEDWMLEDAG